MKPATLASLAYHAAALVGRLPCSWLRTLGDAMAWAWRRSDARESRVARRNLEIAFPDLLPGQREDLHQAILRTTALQALETLRFWTRPPAENLRLLRERHGEALYDAALASGKGVIVAAPHFGNWELLNQWLASRGPIAIVYRPPESPVGDAFLLRVRGADNIRQVRAEGPAVRQLWKVLKDGGAVGILPDQQPKAGDGEFAPFFGTQALTMTLVLAPGRTHRRDGAVRLVRGDRPRSRLRAACGTGPARHRRSGSGRRGDRTQPDRRAHRAPRPRAVPVDLQTLYPRPQGQRRGQSLPLKGMDKGEAMRVRRWLTGWLAGWVVVPAVDFGTGSSRVERGFAGMGPLCGTEQPGETRECRSAGGAPAWSTSASCATWRSMPRRSNCAGCPAATASWSTCCVPPSRPRR